MVFDLKAKPTATAKPKPSLLRNRASGFPDALSISDVHTEARRSTQDEPSA
jgi:hypothetical protein